LLLGDVLARRGSCPRIHPSVDPRGPHIARLCRRGLAGLAGQAWRGGLWKPTFSRARNASKSRDGSPASIDQRRFHLVDDERDQLRGSELSKVISSMIQLVGHDDVDETRPSDSSEFLREDIEAV
jgi:hypothetical protein